MKILFIEWNSLCIADVKLAFSNLGYTWESVAAPKKDWFERNEEFEDQVEKKIVAYKPDFVFSMNFFPSVSIVCDKTHTKYLSWIYDNPQTSAYHISVRNECNYVFSYDSHMVEQLRSRGVPHIYYAPMAVNAKRLQAMSPNKSDVERYSCDVAFVGSLYNEGTDYYSTMLARANDDYFTGFLEGLLNSQKLVYGYNFMAEVLTAPIVEKFRDCAKDLLPEDSLLTEREIYADVFLSQKLATINRMELLYMLGNYFDVHFYTYNESMLENVKHRGTVNYESEMPRLFQVAKVNLNDTRRSNKNGIPLRAMDIMGCGGFLLSNYQEDFFRHFEPGVHMDMYGSLDEAVDKCDFYLKHETEREQIKQKAREIMAAEHTYEIRLGEMLKLARI